MPEVDVYYYIVPQPNSIGVCVTAPRPATLTAIKWRKGSAILLTKLTVDADDLDRQGALRADRMRKYRQPGMS
jgi:hypothetical protein